MLSLVQERVLKQQLSLHKAHCVNGVTVSFIVVTQSKSLSDDQCTVGSQKVGFLQACRVG